MQLKLTYNWKRAITVYVFFFASLAKMANMTWTGFVIQNAMLFFILSCDDYPCIYIDDTCQKLSKEWKTNHKDHHKDNSDNNNNIDNNDNHKDKDKDRNSSNNNNKNKNNNNKNKNKYYYWVYNPENSFGMWDRLRTTTTNTNETNTSTTTISTTTSIRYIKTPWQSRHTIHQRFTEESRRCHQHYEGIHPGTSTCAWPWNC